MTTPEKIQHAAAIADAIGGTLCSPLDGDPPRCAPGDTNWTGPSCPRFRIHFDGELYALEIRDTWQTGNRGPRFTARLCLHPAEPFRNPPHCAIGSDAPTFAWNRGTLDLAADIRRRAIDAQRPAALESHRKHLARAREEAERAGFVDELARLFGAELRHQHRYNGDTWTAPGIDVTRYDANEARTGAALRVTLTMPLDAWRAIAPTIRHVMADQARLAAEHRRRHGY